jgi:ABC-type uncharacterized transport system permease subunit
MKTPYARYALMAAALYLLPILFIVSGDRYGATDLLYVGNVLFAVAIVASVRRNGAPIHTSMLTSLLGVSISFLLLLPLFWLDMPHLLRPIILLNSIVGNLAASGVVAALFSFLGKRERPVRYL